MGTPVSGGEVGAKQASLTIMVGGRTEVFARALPLFQAMGKAITHVGDHGAGQITKVANQIIVALNIAAVAEALVFASKAGADPSRVRQALMGGFAAGLGRHGPLGPGHGAGADGRSQPAVTAGLSVCWRV